MRILKFECHGSCKAYPSHVEKALSISADCREGDEDSNFSVFRIRGFTEWPGPLH